MSTNALYKIKIDYTTGDSYNTEDTSDVLELTWNNLDVAKDALRRIKEHYKMNRTIDRSYSRKEIEAVIKDNLTKDWFVLEKLVKDVIDEHKAKYCIKLKNDAGNVVQFRCFWCGHFESLHSASIVSDDSDMIFIPD